MSRSTGLLVLLAGGFALVLLLLYLARIRGGDSRIRFHEIVEIVAASQSWFDSDPHASGAARVRPGFPAWITGVACAAAAAGLIRLLRAARQQRSRSKRS